MTPNTLKPNSSSSRFCGPLPVIRTTAGKGPAPGGIVSVPASVTGPFVKVTSSAR